VKNRYTRRRFDRLVSLVEKLNTEMWEQRLTSLNRAARLRSDDLLGKKRRGKISGALAILEKELVDMCVVGLAPASSYTAELDMEAFRANAWVAKNMKLENRKCYRCAKAPGTCTYDGHVWCKPCYEDHTGRSICEACLGKGSDDYMRMCQECNGWGTPTGK
jgi:hypothetical protein